jgi:hypothetical protein
LANADESAIQIHFGTTDKPLFTKYMNSKGTVFYPFSNYQTAVTLPRIPPDTVLGRLYKN